MDIFSECKNWFRSWVLFVMSLFSTWSWLTGTVLVQNKWFKVSPWISLETYRGEIFFLDPDNFFIQQNIHLKCRLFRLLSLHFFPPLKSLGVLRLFLDICFLIRKCRLSTWFALKKIYCLCWNFNYGCYSWLMFSSLSVVKDICFILMQMGRQLK